MLRWPNSPKERWWPVTAFANLEPPLTAFRHTTHEES